jgi:poly(hydroxyalkanoate) granule-associated protein
MANIEQIKTQAKKVQEDVTTSAHKVLLAGLGAAAMVQEEQEKLFDRLVTRGKKVETEGKKKLEAGKKQLTAARKKTEKTLERWQGEVDTRVSKLVQRLGIPHQDQIRTLSDRVAELTRKIDSLQKSSKVSA